MNAQLDALRALLGKVKDGSLSGEPADMNLAQSAIGDEFMGVAESYKGSLDAAKALHDAVLPGWDGNFSLDGVAAVWRTRPTYVGRSSNPARAWLIAILEALIAQHEVMA